MNSKTIKIENPSELTNEGGRIAWNWKVDYLAETDRYYAFQLTEKYHNPHPKAISMQISKKTKLMIDTNTFMRNHYVEILFELPYGKWVTKTLELGRFRHVNLVIKCMMDGIQEVNKI